MNWQSIDTAPFDELVLLYGMHNGEPYCWLGLSKRYDSTITWDGAVFSAAGAIENTNQVFQPDERDFEPQIPNSPSGSTNPAFPLRCPPSAQRLAIFFLITLIHIKDASRQTVHQEPSAQGKRPT